MGCTLTWRQHSGTIWTKASDSREVQAQLPTARLSHIYSRGLRHLQWQRMHTKRHHLPKGGDRCWSVMLFFCRFHQQLASFLHGFSDEILTFLQTVSSSDVLQSHGSHLDALLSPQSTGHTAALHGLRPSDPLLLWSPASSTKETDPPCFKWRACWSGKDLVHQLSGRISPVNFSF